MGRKQVVEVQCSRCTRVETQDVPAAGAPAVGSGKAFSAELWVQGQVGPVRVAFEDLCGPCERTVRVLVDQIGKRIEGVSPDRKAATKEETSSTATSSPATPFPVAKKAGTAPNGTAPAPHHSAAASASAKAPARS